MRSKRIILQAGGWLLGGAVVLAVAGCSVLLPTPPPTVPAEAIHTMAAQTVIAQLTRSAPPPTQILPPTDTPLPALSETPVLTDTPTVPPTQTPSATLPSEPAPTGSPVPTVLFSDDFSSETGWYTNQGEDFGFEFAEGGYEIYVDILNAPIWSIREREFSDVILEVEAKKVSGAGDAYFGVVCRHNDNDNYYALVISADGSYGIGKSEDGKFDFLEMGTAPQGVIRSGEAVNRVRGWCVSGGLTLAANDVILMEIADQDFDSGYIGLIAGTRLSGGVRVLFDNFVVLKP
jgi:hypothetical protein